MKAAIVSVGNELLFGQTIDTNAAWLSRQLSERGIRVERRFTVGDVDDEIRGALTAAMGSADIVFISGGLGPTPDDRTKEAVADLLGRALVEDERARREVEERFAASGYDSIPLLSRGQAVVPQGAIVLRNPRGTAPGLLLTHGGVDVVLLPGVPREFKAIVAGELEPVLADRLASASAGDPVHHRAAHTTGIRETLLAEALEEHLTGLSEETTRGISIAYLPDLRGVDLRFTILGGTAADAAVRFDHLLDQLDPVLRPWRFESERGDLAEAVSDALRDRGATMAVAESCTGGLLAKRITDLAGSGDVFLGGVVAYSNEAKIRHVGVSREDLEGYGAVSDVVAGQLAEGVAERFGADVGVGITGIAGPTGGTEEKPVGTVWLAVTVDGSTTTEVGRFGGDREAIRERAAQAALAQVHRRLLDVAGQG